MTGKRDDPGRDPRSLYLSNALVSEVRRLADASRRSYSAQLCHLCELGLTVADRISFEEAAEMDDVAQRQHFYPDVELDELIANVSARARQTYSAAARALVRAGLRLCERSSCRVCAPARGLDHEAQRP